MKALSPADKQVVYEKSDLIELDGQHPIIFEKGDVGNCLYILIDGAVDITTIDIDRRESVVSSYRKPGDYFGEQALFDSLINRTARAVVVSDLCVLRKINKQEFDEFIINQEGMYEELNQQGNNRLQKDSLIFSKFLSEHIDGQLKEEKIAQGTVLSLADEQDKRFYLILDGTAEVFVEKDERDVDETLIAKLVEGNYFGGAAILKQQDKISIRAGEGLTVVSIDMDDFKKLYEDKSSTTVKDYINSMNGFIHNDHGVTFSQHQSHYKNQKSLTTLLRKEKGESCSITKLVSNKHVAKYAKQVDVIGAKGEKQDVNLEAKDLLYTTVKNKPYPRLYVQNNCLIGAEIDYEYSKPDQIISAIIERKYIWPWHHALYRSTGDLWVNSFHDDPRDQAVICSCMGTTRGELKKKVALGCDNFEQLKNETGASSVCEACENSVIDIAKSVDLSPAKIVSVPESEKYCNDKKDIRYFRFKHLNAAIETYAPGQHIRLEAEINGRWIQRAYTLTSVADLHDYYEIAVKLEEKGVFSNWLHNELTEQSDIRMSRPQGDDLELDTATQDPIVCLVNGVGVTPAIAFMRYLSREKSQKSLYIDYSVRKENEVAFKQEFKQLDIENFKATLRITRGKNKQLENEIDSRITIENKRISETDIKNICNQYPKADFYICGSKGYNETIKKHLQDSGIAEIKIHDELFDNSLKRPLALMLGSLITLVFAVLFFIMPPYQTPASVKSINWMALFPGEYSGYGILGLGVIGLLISLPRRYDWVRKFDSGTFRLIHVWLGGLALILLFLHTGFSMGSIHTIILMICFLALFIMGSAAGITISLQDKFSPAQTYSYKKGFKWIHIIVSWPLPVLLLTHILSTYIGIWF